VSSHAPEDGAHDDRQSGQRPRIRGLRSTSAKYHQDPAGKRSWSCASAETTSQPTDWSCVFAQTTVSSIRAIPGALPGPRFFFRRGPAPVVLHNTVSPVGAAVPAKQAPSRRRCWRTRTTLYLCKVAHARRPLSEIFATGQCEQEGQHTLFLSFVSHEGKPRMRAIC
jgi:hypothetical protein